MRNEIGNSCIPVAIPTALYLRLTDVLRARKSELDQATAISAAIGEWISNTASETAVADTCGTGAESGSATQSPQWRDEWIAFDAPPAPDRNPGSMAASGAADWCIGCACPSEELLS